MTLQNPYKTYEENSVITSSPGELTLMLYNGCLKFIMQAKKSIGEGNIEEKNKALQKAQAIITELSITLDRSFPVAENMLQLYDFAKLRLIEGNIKNDITKIDEAYVIIKEFRDTWKEVIQINRQKQFGKTVEI